MRVFQLLAPLLLVGVDVADAVGDMYLSPGSPGVDVADAFPDAPPPWDIYLNPRERMSPGTTITMTSKCTGQLLWLTFQTDGNLVYYTRNPIGVVSVIWSSDTVAQNSADVDAAVMQTDGNFVIYEKGGVAKWDTGTYPNTNGESNFLTMHDDETLSVGSSSHPKKWTSGTACNTLSLMPYPALPRCKAGKLEHFEEFLVDGYGVFECQSACGRKLFMYAGIYRSRECYCGNSVGAPVPNEDCFFPCPNSPEDSCGGMHCTTAYHSRGSDGGLFSISKTKED